MKEFFIRVVSEFFVCWALWLPVTFWFGRVFCRRICPLGLSQSLVQLLLHPKRRVRRVCTELPRTKVQLLVNWTLVGAYFFAPLGYLLNPWGIFGRAAFVFFVPGILLFAGILILAAFGKGRIWCNWICPLGTMFDFAAKLGWRQDKISRSCGNCRRCFK